MQDTGILRGPFGDNRGDCTQNFYADLVIASEITAMNGFVVSNTIAQDVQMSNTGKNIFRLARGCVRESKAQRIGPQIVLVPPNQERSPESEIQLANDARMIQGFPVGNHKILGSLYLYAADGWNELFEVIEPTHIVTQSDIQLLEFSVDGVS